MKLTIDLPDNLAEEILDAVAENAGWQAKIYDRTSGEPTQIDNPVSKADAVANAVKGFLESHTNRKRERQAASSVQRLKL